MPILAVLYIYN